ncbi:hypothetical protein QVM02_25190, partial [Pseudomonas aeruginosa]
ALRSATKTACRSSNPNPGYTKFCTPSAANSEWWEAPGYSALQDGLPQDLVDDFRHLGADEDAA